MHSNNFNEKVSRCISLESKATTFESDADCFIKKSSTELTKSSATKTEKKVDSKHNTMKRRGEPQD